MSKQLPPIQTLRDGLITASIWQTTANDGSNRYSVTFSRSYLKEEAWHTTHSFSREEILKVSRLADLAYSWIKSQFRKDKAQINSGEAV
ncbi:hypothetical protein [Ponticaulis sp.]|uniref:hypothetical protein n=1 Tax=Ponticaulis sp. TaxID=2020902 RepID=UPI000B640DAD|nr:hypothetical protein [Ponticaulis sp.]MAJ09858.1 hypothetical protein [Ponticaulis sp.]RPG18471.1 MAG: hypothetical protein CBC85_001780 [Hyphomonadaceae bacterium TMED125]|tara:strand:- start:24121 stop:24387 length:267 start_codon:yes stop_codon:yes gene_type:complete